MKRPNLHFGYEKQASYFPSTPNRGQKFKQVRMLMRLQNRMGISQRRDNVSVYPCPSPTLQRNSFHHSNLNIPVADLITVVYIPTQLWYLLIYSHENLPKTQTAYSTFCHPLKETTNDPVFHLPLQLNYPSSTDL